MKYFILSSFILFGLLVYAQEQVPEMITDRPDQTESSSVVPVKTLQIETGFLIENNETNYSKQKATVYNTTLLRYGLLEKMELRVGVAYLDDEEDIKETDTVNSITGFSPLYAGFKIYITEEKGWIPEIAFLGGLVFPFTAHEDFKAPYTAPTGRFSFSHTLSETFSLSYNLGGEWYGETAVPDYFYSVALGISITDKIGAFVEGFGFLPEEGPDRHIVDGGFTFLARRNLQFDVSGGFGINDAALDNFISVGLSWRVPR